MWKTCDKAPGSNSDQRHGDYVTRLDLRGILISRFVRSFIFVLLPPLFHPYSPPPLMSECGVNKQRPQPPAPRGENSPALGDNKSDLRGVMQVPGPEERDLDGGPSLARGGGGAFVHAPSHQPAGQERQTEESHSIPASVPTAPPSAQRSWTGQPECGEHCYLTSFSSSYAVLDGATLKVSCVI